MVKPQNDVAEVRVLPGLRLRQARTEQSISIVQAAEYLGLTERALKALEADDYSKLPRPVYVRGYIKRYCVLLNIDASDILEDFEGLIENGNEQSAGQEKKHLLENPWLRTVVVSAVGILLLLIALVTFAEHVEGHAQLMHQLGRLDRL